MNSPPLDRVSTGDEHGPESRIVRLEVNMDNVVMALGSLQRSVDAMRIEFTQALDGLRAEVRQGLQDQRSEFHQALQEQRSEFYQALQEQRSEFHQALQEQHTDFQQGLSKQTERLDALIYEMGRERRWIIGYIMANSGLLLGVLLRNHF